MVRPSGIIKLNNGEYGFKISTNNVDEINKIKDEIRKYYISKNIPVVYNFAYYDKKEYRDL